MNTHPWSKVTLAAVLLASGCGSQGGIPGNPINGNDLSLPPHGDLASIPDLAIPPQQDLAVATDLSVPIDFATTVDSSPSRDLAIVYRPTILVEELLTTVPVGGNPVAAKIFAPVVLNPDPALARPSDYDTTDVLGLGCSANHYLVGGGDDPTPDANLGTVTINGETTGAALTGMMIPSEINCALVNNFYQCAFGPLVNGAPNPQTGVSSIVFPGALEMAKVGTAVQVKYSGGLAGNFDSLAKLVATDRLSSVDDLSKVKYDPAIDTTLHFVCVNKPQNCFDAVLVQIVASSVAPGGVGYPGADYGVINCAGLANTGQIVIPRDAIKAMYGGSAAIKYVMTRLVRGALPPAGLLDSHNNPVRLALGRGEMAFAPR